MKKVSEFLQDLDAHEVYNAAGLAEAYKAETGEDPCWPTHTVATTKQNMEARGLGGNVSGPDDELVAWGWEMAEACAEKYANGYKPFTVGRGSRFKNCLGAIKNAGN